jgi:hypothetical protein
VFCGDCRAGDRTACQAIEKVSYRLFLARAASGNIETCDFSGSLPCKQ